VVGPTGRGDNPAIRGPDKAVLGQVADVPSC
jgi:hypothetical protein